MKIMFAFAATRLNVLSLKMSNWKTKKYEIKLKLCQRELDSLKENLKGCCEDILTKLNSAFHKEVMRTEKEKDIKLRKK
jgi:hypothetical protein